MLIDLVGLLSQRDAVDLGAVYSSEDNVVGMAPGSWLSDGRVAMSDASNPSKLSESHQVLRNLKFLNIKQKSLPVPEHI